MLGGEEGGPRRKKRQRLGIWVPDKTGWVLYEPAVEGELARTLTQVTCFHPSTAVRIVHTEMQELLDHFWICYGMDDDEEEEDEGGRARQGRQPSRETYKGYV